MDTAFSSTLNANKGLEEYDKLTDTWLYTSQKKNKEDLWQCCICDTKISQMGGYWTTSIVVHHIGMPET